MRGGNGGKGESGAWLPLVMEGRTGCGGEDQWCKGNDFSNLLER